MNHSLHNWKEAERVRTWHLKQKGWSQHPLAEAPGVDGTDDRSARPLTRQPCSERISATTLKEPLRANSPPTDNLTSALIS
jgi:hypothetical protein